MATLEIVDICHEFNFGDGDIILAVTENAISSTLKDTVYLEVHKAMLRMHSAVFDKMLELPWEASLADAQEVIPRVIDGLPVVQLHDEPEDVLNLTKVTDLSPSIRHKPLRQATLDFVSFVVKVADKYDMSGIAKSMVPRLEADWPVTLQKWDLIQKQIETIKDHVQKRREQNGDNLKLKLLGETLVEPASVIRFARDHDQFHRLPSAFYQLSCLTCAYDEGGIASAQAKEEHLYYGGRAVQRRYLQVEDFETLWVGQAALKVWLRNVIEAGTTRLEKCSCIMNKRCTRAGWWERNAIPQLLPVFANDEVDVLARI